MISWARRGRATMSACPAAAATVAAAPVSQPRATSPQEQPRELRDEQQAAVNRPEVPAPKRQGAKSKGRRQLEQRVSHRCGRHQPRTPEPEAQLPGERRGLGHVHGPNAVRRSEQPARHGPDAEIERQATPGDRAQGARPERPPSRRRREEAASPLSFVPCPGARRYGHAGSMIAMDEQTTIKDTAGQEQARPTSRLDLVAAVEPASRAARSFSLYGCSWSRCRSLARRGRCRAWWRLWSLGGTP